MAESGLLRKRITDSLELYDASIDNISGAVKTIDVIHSEIHSGDLYKAIFYSSTLVNSTTINLQINGYVGKYIHLKQFDISISNGFVDVQLLSASSTITAGTSAIVAYNKKRTSTSLTNVGLFNGATPISTTFTVLDRFFLGSTSATAQQIRPGLSRSYDDEWIIGNSTYILQMTISSTGTVTLAAALLFYEGAST